MQVYNDNAYEYSKIAEELESDKESSYLKSFEYRSSELDNTDLTITETYIYFAISIGVMIICIVVLVLTYMGKIGSGLSLIKKEFLKGIPIAVVGISSYYTITLICKLYERYNHCLKKYSKDYKLDDYLRFSCYGCNDGKYLCLIDGTIYWYIRNKNEIFPFNKNDILNTWILNKDNVSMLFNNIELPKNVFYKNEYGELYVIYPHKKTFQKLIPILHTFPEKDKQESDVSNTDDYLEKSTIEEFPKYPSQEYENEFPEFPPRFEPQTTSEYESFVPSDMTVFDYPFGQK